ncbi:SDR family oxidoreductase [Providencia burhodogranariea]|uniref:NAD-dependent epimerase/dehydratase domain-containing protein n=1 Tax=Providencia burhodogranariea DSM 19968 TaxID=1141662 RepID=K8WJC1_9GAMM|nr:SDR family oxidoreductase [Providencia burhodogranariea]EKT60698.1 hypothetical Protein OOA_11698 [Providencia burhodogranariea DSM 19968]
MRIFVTGATGFLGSTIVHQLLSQGYQVLGLTRSKQGAAQLTSLGAEVHLGDINDLDSLRIGSTLADGIIHTAFNHDFSTFAANCQTDRLAIEAMGSVLKGLDKPFIVTSIAGMGALENHQLALENQFNIDSTNPRKESELAALQLIEQGINVSIIRLPQVHNTIKQGLITDLKQLAKQKGVSAYVDDGQNRWAAVHISDAARLYLLALQRQSAGSRYHAVAEEGISLKSIAKAIANGLNIPTQSMTQEQSQDHFGWLHRFVNHDMSASSIMTQRLLGWKPIGPSLLSDLQQMEYD